MQDWKGILLIIFGLIFLFVIVPGLKGVPVQIPEEVRSELFVLIVSLTIGLGCGYEHSFFGFLTGPIISFFILFFLFLVGLALAIYATGLAPILVAPGAIPELARLGVLAWIYLVARGLIEKVLPGSIVGATVGLASRILINKHRERHLKLPFTAEEKKEKKWDRVCREKSADEGEFGDLYKATRLALYHRGYAFSDSFIQKFLSNCSNIKSEDLTEEKAWAIYAESFPQPISEKEQERVAKEILNYLGKANMVELIKSLKKAKG